MFTERKRQPSFGGTEVGLCIFEDIGYHVPLLNFTSHRKKQIQRSTAEKDGTMRKKREI